MRRPLAVVDRRLLSETIAEQAHLTGVPNYCRRRAARLISVELLRGGVLPKNFVVMELWERRLSAAGQLVQAS